MTEFAFWPWLFWMTCLIFPLVGILHYRICRKYLGLSQARTFIAFLIPFYSFPRKRIQLERVDRRLATAICAGIFLWFVFPFLIGAISSLEISKDDILVPLAVTAVLMAHSKIFLKE